MLFEPLTNENESFGSGTGVAHRLAVDCARLRGQVGSLSGEKHVGGIVSSAFSDVARTADGRQRSGRRAGVLLRDVCQLVRQQPFSCGRPWAIATGAEHDVAAKGVCLRMECIGGGRRLSVGVNANIG